MGANLSKSEFRKHIFNNEVAWTYLIAKIAEYNPNVYAQLAGFNPQKNHNVFLEGQPLVPYIGDEGNSHIDMALGALVLRGSTTSGIQFDCNNGEEVCFVEAKYLSDLSVRTRHYPIRDQMDRILENLLCFQGNGKFPSKLVFTLLTPRIFKQTHGSRLYAYKFKEYSEKLGMEDSHLAERIKLKSSEKTRDKHWEYPEPLSARLNSLKLNWVTFEHLLEVGLNGDQDIKRLDITKMNDAKFLWKASWQRVLDRGE